MVYTIDNRTIIRFANETDVKVILFFIKELAEYEGMIDKVEATEELLMQTIFHEKKAEVIICEYDNKPVGFALFFHNFSTFLGKPGIYLEDLYVIKEMRHRGLGKRIISVLGKIALARNCGRLEWWCLDSNAKSIEFYLGLGAKAMLDWTVYRVSGNDLLNISNIF